MSLTAWALTTGEAGMRTQARGLARASVDVVVEKVLSGPATWPWSPFPLAPDLRPPWPDVVVSCGRRSVAAALAVRRLSGGRTLAVHVQDPRRRAGAFDLVVAMAHDRIAAGERVIKTPTALHDLTAGALAKAGRAWEGRFAPLGRPLTGVVLGGDLRGRAFTLRDGARLLDGLRRLRAGAGGALAITPSRRTPLAVRAQFAAAFAADPGVFLWNLEGDNPYRAILALSDRLVVTSDSVSMVSEALATPNPVEVFDLGFARHVGFIQGLVDRGLIRRFEGDPAPPATAGPFNATEEAARAVRRLLQARAQALTGVVG
jgi:mitochondrial fission protein ELM1